MKISLAIAALVAAAGSASADVVASWTFEDATRNANYVSTSTYGIADAGVITAGTNAFANTGGTAATPVGNGSFESMSNNAWDIGDYYEFQVITTGYTNITFGWDQTRSGTGPTNFNLLVSTDGGATFSNLLANYAVLANAAPNPVWSSGTYQAIYTFSPVAAGAGAANNSLVIFRISAATAGAAGGTNRVDNVTVNGDVVPTPGSLALVGLGGLVATRRRR